MGAWISILRALDGEESTEARTTATIVSSLFFNGFVYTKASSSPTYAMPLLMINLGDVTPTKLSYWGYATSFEFSLTTWSSI